ncbi:MAG: TlpA disulfide reductase family protein [Flavobacteriaceae bacterium]|nr:TlpA family protein disulfide reductase [Flavobacteriaceae bacterium]
MKPLSLLFIAMSLFSCNQKEEKDFVTVSGKIINKNSDSLKIQNKDYSKAIFVNPDGTFSDTLHIEPGMYSLNDGVEGTRIFLNNGYDLSISLDTEMFDETIKYEGMGAENNNFLAEKALLEEKLLDFDVDQMSQESLTIKLAEVEKEIHDFIASKTALDTMVINSSKKNMESTIKSYGDYFSELIALRVNLPVGALSPVFENYENHSGGTTSLSDLKGKYVYIDVWATWCGPCKVEIPFLKEVEKEYHNKNIEFVSISVDKAKDHEKWVNMVKEKELGGIQLFADNDWDSSFVKEYYINGIPRFILIDPEGNIVTPDAPRPSSPKLRELLNGIL